MSEATTGTDETLAGESPTLTSGWRRVLQLMCDIQHDYHPLAAAQGRSRGGRHAERQRLGEQTDRPSSGATARGLE